MGQKRPRSQLRRKYNVFESGIQRSAYSPCPAFEKKIREKRISHLMGDAGRVGKSGTGKGHAEHGRARAADWVSRFRRVAWVIIGVGAFFISGCEAGEKAEAPTAMPVKVEAAPVREETLDRLLTAVGSLSSPQETVVAPQVAGRIVFLNVEQGKVAEDGETLARLDDSVQKAAVLGAQAALLNARQIYEKDKKVAGTGGVSEKQLQSDESAVKQAEAQLEQADANLRFTVVQAPFTGLLGLRKVSLGAYLKEGDAIVSIRQLDPLYLDFDLPQQHVGELKLGQEARFTVSGMSELFHGKVTTVDTALASGSRSVHVQATVHNAARLLKPGMFALVNLVVGRTPGALFVPMQSIVSEGQIKHVWVVAPGERAELKKVEVGLYQYNWVQIIEGITSTDRVITAGVQKLYPGAKLVVTPYQPIHNPRLDLTNPEVKGPS
jgi:RND family efflux transporter MFP subunit